jgi:hypothetical protein
MIAATLRTSKSVEGSPLPADDSRHHTPQLEHPTRKARGWQMHSTAAEARAFSSMYSSALCGGPLPQLGALIRKAGLILLEQETAGT